MSTEKSAAPYVPETRDLTVLREAVQGCHECDLYKHATQAVFGESEVSSSRSKHSVALMIIGEQPGDREDLEGHPFVGPAGRLLDECLEEAGIDRGQVYVTNAVKHFKWEPRGKRRIHKKPTIRETKACRPWLDAEMDSVHPKLLVCLGATAAQSLLGSKFRITEDRGKLIRREGLPPVAATVHPSAILRARTDEDRHREKLLFTEDLRKIKLFVEQLR